MRQALVESLGGQLRETVAYPRGSVVVCTSCAKPIYRLERGICAGEKAGRCASVFKPLTTGDVVALQARAVSGAPDAGLVAALRTWSMARVTEHVQKLTEPKAGDPMACPACGDVFVQSRSSELSDTHDRAYVLELVTVPPVAAHHG